MWDFFSNVVEDIQAVCNDTQDDELVKYVTLNIPECLSAYFGSKLGITSVKVRGKEWVYKIHMHVHVHYNFAYVHVLVNTFL